MNLEDTERTEQSSGANYFQNQPIFNIDMLSPPSNKILSIY